MGLPGQRRRRLAGAERCSRVSHAERCSRDSQFALNCRCERVRTAKHAPLFLAVEKGPAAVARLLLRWGADPEIPREDGETVFTAHFESLVDARALLAENYLSAGAPFDYDPEDAERLAREQAPFRPFPPLWVRFLRVVGAALLVVLIQADWTQRKLRDYFLRPLARLTNRVSPRGYQTYDWEE